MYSKVLVIAALSVVSQAGYIGEIGVSSGYGGGYAKTAVVDQYAPPKYEFKYAVADPKTGDKKEQTEIRDGDVVKGQYSLAEPDGTIRVVKYTADKASGFNAIVEKIGKAIETRASYAVPVVQKNINLEGGLGLRGGSGIGAGLGLGRGLGFGEGSTLSGASLGVSQGYGNAGYGGAISYSIGGGAVIGGELAGRREGY